jgi:hypothetical protein
MHEDSPFIRAHIDIHTLGRDLEIQHGERRLMRIEAFVDFVDCPTDLFQVTWSTVYVVELAVRGRSALAPCA